MKTQAFWRKMLQVARVLARQIVSNVGTVVLVLALLFMADLAGAAPWKATPKKPAASRQFILPYQGRLTDALGNPINNTGQGLEMTFALYTQATGGTPVWSERHTSVPVSDGLFNVYLGSISSLDPALFDNDLWMGVKIGNDLEMTPRERAMPYAVGMQSSGVPVGTVVSWWRPDAGTPLPSDDWAIADGSVVSDPASPLYGKTLPNLTDRFVMGVVMANIGQTGGSNTLNLSHQHVVDSHTHILPDHSHGSGTLRLTSPLNMTECI